MGNGFCILIWDAFGSGLVRINARLLEKGEDMYGNPKNWFSYKDEQNRAEQIEQLTKGLKHYEIIES